MSGLDLKNATAWNYDVVFSFFNNSLGLFTVGAYYKDFKNIDYPLTERNWSNEEYGFTAEQALFGYTINRFVNAPVSTIKGIEVDLQTNLSFLPSPLDGIVLNANFTRAITETPFPQFKWEKTGSFPFYEYNFWREYRYGKMPGNAENLGNVAIGYEKRGFSCRVSYLHQGDFLSRVGAVPEEDTYVRGWHRWDIAMKQKITDRFSVSLDWQNITDQDEAGYQYLSNSPTYSQFYGWRIYLGLRYDAR
jgi:outer membrane receptor protein involved in Fe transport